MKTSIKFICVEKIIFILKELYFYRKHLNTISINNKKLTIDAFYNFITLTKDLINRGFNNNKILHFLINTFIYKMGSLGKILFGKDLNVLFLASLEHLKYLKIISQKCNVFYRIKIIFSIFILNIFKESSFKIFRVLKNLL